MELKVGAFYVTRDGRKARIYALDGEADTSAEVHGAVLEDGEAWVMTNWGTNGKLYTESQSPQDLVGVWVEPAASKLMVAWICIERPSQADSTREGDIWFSKMTAQPNSAYWRRAPWLDEP